MLNDLLAVSIRSTMCKFSILVHNTSGYLIQCGKCGQFQLAFGTVELSLKAHELEELYAALKRQKYPLIEGELFRKTIRVRPGQSNVALALSPFEAKEMTDMIDEAWASLVVNQLLSDFNC